MTDLVPLFKCTRYSGDTPCHGDPHNLDDPLGRVESQRSEEAGDSEMATMRVCGTFRRAMRGGPGHWGCLLEPIPPNGGGG